MGSFYKRKWKRKDGSVVEGDVWWIQYYDNDGRVHRESAETTDRAEAKRLLKRREGRVAKGKAPAVRYDRVKFSELVELYLQDYKLNNQNIEDAKLYVKDLTPHFGRVRVVHITTKRISDYIIYKQQWACNDCSQRFEAADRCPECGSDDLTPGASNATVNRRLSALKRMLNLGAEQEPPLVDRVPKIKMLKENNVRKGFFEQGDFNAMRDHLPEHLQGIATFAYYYGWRHGEITNLEWARVDRRKWTVRLEAGETKNEAARTIYLNEECKEVFKREWQRRKELGTALPYVFLNRDGSDRVKTFRKAWKSACKKAGIGSRIFHDLRRTAVRNMIRNGIPETVAMQISGHKTRSVFDRYNIVDGKDLEHAAQLMTKATDTELSTEQGSKRKFFPITN